MTDRLADDMGAQRQLIGVDVGGTKVAAARFANGSLDAPHVVPTLPDDRDRLLDQLVDAVEQVRTPDCAAVGVATPGAIDFAAGRVRFAANVRALVDMPLRDLLRERLGLPVYVDNDATVAALAEASAGGRIVVSNLVIFTVGTGVGGGIVIGGRIYRGATGAAAEIGQTLVAADPAGAARDWNEVDAQPGSLETLAAGPVLDRLAREAAAAAPDSALGRLAAAHEEITGHDAVALAQQGDAASAELVATLGRRLGLGIANAINVFDPDEVVIGGGVSAAGDLLLEPARATALRYAFPGVGTRTTIRLARLGGEAGVLGAALMAGHELEGEQSA